MAKTSSTTFFDPELVNAPVLNQWHAEFNRAVADLSRFWSNGKATDIDLSWLLSYQHKNIEALTVANECSFETAITNVGELAELVRRSRTETFDVIYKRVIESFEEVKAAFEPKPAKKAA